MFVFDNVGIDVIGCDVVRLVGWNFGEVFIVVEIKVCFGIIIGYIVFVMLIG